METREPCGMETSVHIKLGDRHASNTGGNPTYMGMWCNVLGNKSTDH